MHPLSIPNYSTHIDCDGIDEAERNILGRVSGQSVHRMHAPHREGTRSNPRITGGDSGGGYGLDRGR